MIILKGDVIKAADLLNNIVYVIVNAKLTDQLYMCYTDRKTAFFLDKLQSELLDSGKNVNRSPEDLQRIIKDLFIAALNGTIYLS